MISGYYDRDTGRYFTDLESDEFYSPTFDYHRIMEKQKQPTATTLFEFGDRCHKRIYLKYNLDVYYCNKDFFYMWRGTLIHRSLFHNIRYKEFFLGIMRNGLWASGSSDGYNPGGRLYEAKTVGNITKDMRFHKIRERDAFQQLMYHWFLRMNDLPSIDSIIHYVSYFDEIKTIVKVEDLFKFTRFKDWDDFVAYVDQKLKVFPGIVRGKTKQIDLSECTTCDFWNQCTQGKAQCIAHFKKTGKTQRGHPVWRPNEIQRKMRGDKTYRNKLYIQTLAIIDSGKSQ